MTGYLENIVLDNGLNVLNAQTSVMYVCSSEPTTFALASSGASSLGSKSWGAGNVFGPPGTASPNGMKVTSAQINDGVIATAGIASWWAACSGSALYAHGVLANPQSVSIGNIFTLGQFDIRIPNQ